jgi:hypothetical protein
MTLAIGSPLPVDQLYPAFESGYMLPIVSAQTLTATAQSAFVNLPYIGVGAKARLIVNLTAISGSGTPSLTVAYNESPDGVSLNPSAVLTTAALTAVGEVWAAAVAGPIFNQGQFSFTVAGTTPSVTFSAWLAVWMR